jgi:hypothetical protein
MTDPQTPHPRSPIPPPPPRQGSRRGCLHAGLAGCGALALLAVIAIVAGTIWWRRNGDELTARAGEAAREGARAGLVSDEAACFETAPRRIGTGATVADNFAVGAFARACLEFSRETPGFCDNVPPVTALRRSTEWAQQRCGAGNTACQHVSQVVQQYCAAGRPKRTAADTLLMDNGAAPASGSAAVDSGRF